VSAIVRGEWPVHVEEEGASLAKSSPQTIAKREREQAKREKRERKREKKAAAAEAKAAPPAQPGGEPGDEPSASDEGPEST